MTAASRAAEESGVFLRNEGYGLHRLRKNSVLYQGTTLVVP
jgi:hypothetical protein